tara:strand:+ start:4028 stop:5182 length:1155 start_codon:yes stop_codon:yes gene_type:complete
MAVYKLFPTKDASIYSFYPKMNTGIDSIIEIGNLNINYDPVPQVFRFLVKFDQDEIENIIDNKVGGMNFSSSLKCYIATAQGIIADTMLELYPVSGSWNNGSGTYLDSPFTSNGVSWRYRTFSGSGGTQWLNTGYSDYATGSYSGSFLGGGNWYTGSSDPYNTSLTPTQLFDYRTTKDLNVNVSDIVKVWYSSSKSIGSYTNIENQGFIVKWEDAVEFSPSDAVQPIMQFYSVDTNTIYPPCLEIKWDDSSFETGSLSEIDTADLFVALDNNPGTFYSSSINRFRLNVREDFPVRTFQTASIFTTNNFLNSSSLYAVKDLDTDEYVVDFDTNFTKISCDSNGNYFDIYMNGLEPERYYKILIKTTISGSTIVKDDQYYFKVVNG